MTTERGMRFLVFDGMCLLSDVDDRWQLRIDRHRLNMGDYEHCVLGQLYGSFRRGVKVLRIRDPWRYGFICCPLVEECYCDQLTEVWRELLAS